MGTFLHMTTLWKLRGPRKPCTSKDILRTAMVMELLSLYRSSAREAWREGSFTGDPEGYVKKALEPPSLFSRGPVG